MRFWSGFWTGMLLAFAIAKLANSTMKVAIVDTGLNLSDKRFSNKLCLNGHQDLTGYGINDTDGHGTHIAGLIKQYAGDDGDYCLIILKFYDGRLTDKVNEDNEVKALMLAFDEGATIINASEGGTNVDEREYLLLKKHKDVLLIGAAGNQGEHIRSFPGCFGLPNTRCVGSWGPDYKRASFSNYGEWVDVWHPGVEILSTLPNGQEGKMTGTSMSAAIETGMEIQRRTHALH